MMWSDHKERQEVENIVNDLEDLFRSMTRENTAKVHVLGLKYLSDLRPKIKIPLYTPKDDEKKNKEKSNLKKKGDDNHENKDWR